MRKRTMKLEDRVKNHRKRLTGLMNIFTWMDTSKIMCVTSEENNKLASIRKSTCVGG